MFSVENMIALQNVSKSFGNTSVLQSFDLTIPAGITTVLIGPSGCGKSTLLRLIIGLLRPDQGKVYFQGREIVPESVIFLRQKMGYVIQEGGLFPHLTAGDNVTLMARYLKWDHHMIE
jgi:osmoprotectant transport system ATP-binding protein